MPDWLGPPDAWPKHRYPEADRALQEARHAGWWLREAGGSAHIFGTLHCRRTPGSDFCRFVVYSTGGANSEETAHLIREKVAKCQHAEQPEETHDATGSSSGEATAVRGAHFHMDRAEHLLTTIDLLVDRHDLRKRATTLIESAENDAAEAESLLAQAGELDEKAGEASQDALAEAERVDMGGLPWPPANPEARLAGPAEQHLATAESLLEDLRSDDGRAAVRRLQQLRDRLDACRQRLIRVGPNE